MIEPDEWRQPDGFALSPGEVHLWRCRLEVGADTLLACRQSLSADEQARADRFHFEKHRQRFTAARGALRGLLSWYLGAPPGDVQFENAAHGKPSVRHPVTTIRFNLSHAGDLMVAAFAVGVELGVDIEKDHRRVAATDISKRFFTPEEHAEIERQEDGQRLRTFLRYWTAKEAVMKATGLGLSLEPSAIAIAINPLRIISLRAGVAGGWKLHAFQPTAGYTGTLAVGATVERRSYFEWPEAAASIRPA